MYTNITESDFINWFRTNRPNQFSYDGLKSLFEEIEIRENDIGEEINFDPIAICCDYTEYKSIKEFNQDYNYDCKTLDDISEHTVVTETSNGGFIIQNF